MENFNKGGIMKKNCLPTLIWFLFCCGILLFIQLELSVAADYPNAAPTTPLPAVDYDGSAQVNPAAIPVSVAAGPLLIQPTLTVARADRGKTAYLFVYIYLPQARASFNFSAPQPIILGDEANFSAVFPRMIDMTDGGGSVFDIYCAYSLNDEIIKYNAYEVTIAGGSDGGGNSPDDKMADQIDCYLQEGIEPTVALAKLSTDLAQDPEVAAAVLTRDKTGLWIISKSGEQELFEVETLDPLPDDAAGFAGSSEQHIVTGSTRLTTKHQPMMSGLAGMVLSDYVFPETNKALLLNSLNVCVPTYGDSGYDSTKAIAAKLRHIGYEVDRLSGSLDDFTKLTDYSVIFIEARVSRQSGDELISVLCELPILPDNNPTNASIEGSSEVITTSTLVTPALRKQYADDLRFGRLKVRRSWYMFQGKVTRCSPTFAVTPNFIRQHNTSRFPNHTLFYISAGGLLDTNTYASQWQALLAEKSDNGHFVSWIGSPKYVFTQLAAGNLFELLTGADTKYEVVTQTINMPGGRTHVAYELNDNHLVIPPLVNQGMLMAGLTLVTIGDSLDFTTGAMLWFDNHGPEGSMDLALAPILSDFHIDQLGRAEVLGAAPSGSKARFVDVGTLGLEYDLGNYDWPPYTDPVFGSLGYHFEVPVGIAGTLELHDALGRHSTGMIVYTWKPLFKLTWQGDNGQSYTVNLQFVVRALPAPRSSGVKDFSDPYSPPRNNAFDGRFDSTASTVSWSVSGEQTVDIYHYQYHGGGLKQVIFKDDEDNWPINAGFSTAESDDGTSLTVDVWFDSLKLAYTETRTDTSANQDTTTQKTVPLNFLYLTGLKIDPQTLTLQAGTQTNDSNMLVQWGEAAPSPAFKFFTGPR
jgi:hypothetical protein